MPVVYLLVYLFLRPSIVVQTVITNKITKFNKIKQVLVEKCPFYLCLLWLGGINEEFANQISQTLQKFSVNVHMICHTKPTLTSLSKDVIPSHHDNSLIYLFRCSCSSYYIERTE